MLSYKTNNVNTLWAFLRFNVIIENMGDVRQMIVARLRAAREDAGLTQSEVADALGIARSSYTQIETGRNTLSIEHLALLPAILHKPVAYFLGLATGDLASDEAELLELYRTLNEDRRRFVLGFARMAVEQDRKLETGE